LSETVAVNMETKVCILDPRTLLFALSFEKHLTFSKHPLLTEGL
jgi:hypothetical protein